MNEDRFVRAARAMRLDPYQRVALALTLGIGLPKEPQLSRLDDFYSPQQRPISREERARRTAKRKAAKANRQRNKR